MKELNVNYTSFAVLYGKAPIYYQVKGNDYLLFSVTDSLFVTCRITGADVSNFEASHKSAAIEVTDADNAYLLGTYKTQASFITPRTSDGKPVVSMFPTEGTRTTLVTHSWTDRSTWYQKSTYVAQETPSVVTPGEMYQLAHYPVIDTFHGKLWDENNLIDANNCSYRVNVQINTGSGWVTKAEQDPHTEAGDYLVDYHAGTIAFVPDIPTDAQVRVTYHYAGSSEFVMKPLPGKLLKIRTVEVQFSTDVIMTDTVLFIAYGYVDYFAPQYLQANGGPYPSGTKIPLSTTRYKTMYDFQAESNGALPSIPAIGGDSWRGIKTGIMVFPWDYAAMTPLSYSAGMEVRIKLEHDMPFEGEFGTATMYCLSENE